MDPGRRLDAATTALVIDSAADVPAAARPANWRVVPIPISFGDRTFLTTSLMSAAAIVLATELGFLQRILDSVELTGTQWLICIGAGLTVIVASELWKLMLRHREA